MFLQQVLPHDSISLSENLCGSFSAIRPYAILQKHDTFSLIFAGNEDEAMTTAPSSQSSYCSAKESFDSPRNSPAKRKFCGERSTTQGVTRSMEKLCTVEKAFKNKINNIDTSYCNAEFSEGTVNDSEELKISNLVNQQLEPVIQDSNGHDDQDAVENNVFNDKVNCDITVKDAQNGNDEDNDDAHTDRANRTLDSTTLTSSETNMLRNPNPGAASKDICACSQTVSSRRRSSDVRKN